MYLIESPFPVIRLIFHKRKTNPQDYFHLFSLQIPNTFWDGKSTKKEWVIELKKIYPCETTAHFIAKYFLPRVTTTQKFTIFKFF